MEWFESSVLPFHLNIWSHLTEMLEISSPRDEDNQGRIEFLLPYSSFWILEFRIES